jgi:endonuclease/exonuclease/phosphatase family metal-dependent hydrolase
MPALRTSAVALLLVATGATPLAAAPAGAADVSATSHRAAAPAPAAAAASRPAPRRNPAVEDPFTVATVNARGHSHTAPGGNKPRFADSLARTRWAARLFDKHALDVVALQEFEPEQQRAFLARAGQTYGFHGPRANGVAWRLSKFELVSTTALTVPYFYGKPVPMPVVRLRSTTTGQEMVFISVHNPADARGPAQRWRNIAVQRELAYVTALRAEADPVPVFLLGDMNDQRRFFCPITATGVIRAAAGGSNRNGRCVTPTGFRGIDWITATRGVAFSSHEVVRSRLVEKSTDHPLVVARAG